jgi:hypothetical protein
MNELHNLIEAGTPSFGARKSEHGRPLNEIFKHKVLGS